jgi:hypothetical protein
MKPFERFRSKDPGTVRDELLEATIADLRGIPLDREQGALAGCERGQRAVAILGRSAGIDVVLCRSRYRPHEVVDADSSEDVG